jgi:PAS domain S-box-containing protein
MTDRPRDQVLEEVIALLPIGIYIVDSDWRVCEANTVAEKTFGFALGPDGACFDSLVRQIWQSPYADYLLERFRHTLATGEPYCHLEHSERRLDRDQIEHYEWQIRRVVLEDGRPGVLCSFRDVSERVATSRALEAERAELRLKQERLDLAQRATGLGIFDWNIDRAAADISPEWRRIYGLSDTAPVPSFEEWGALIHPDDRERTLAAARAAVQSRDPYYQEYRVVWPDHSVHWVAAAGNTVFDEQSRPVRLLGTVMDITARKEAEIRGAESEQRFRVALLNAPLNMFTVDRELRCTWVYNPTLGFDSREIIGKRDDELMSPEEAAPIIEFKQRVLTTGRGERRQLAVTLHGVTHTYDTTLEPQRDADGRVVGLIGAALDISDLANAKAAAEAASNAKDRFLAVLSHELRTPLTPVLASAILMERDPLLSPEHRAMMRTIRRNVELEARLIDDLLDVTRISKGKLTLQTTIIDAHASIARVIDMCSAEAAEKGLRVTADLAATSHRVSVDPARFQQIIWNLLKNAIKFTSGDGQVRIATLNPAPGRLRVVVTDTGIGIAPQVLPHIFDAFEQGGSQVTQQFGGLGLGLAISKALARLHEGDIVADSAGPGLGSSFALDIPVTSAGAAVSEYSPPAAAGALNFRVLLVEDHADTRQVIEYALTELACRVVTADSVAAAMASAACAKFDVVISDIGLPDASGTALMQELRGRYGMRGIALSGYGRDEDVARSKRAGFDAHLVKPVSLDALEQTLRQLQEVRQTAN